MASTNLKRSIRKLRRKPSNDPNEGSVEARLNSELRRLKELLGLDPGMRVVWKPGSPGELSGEVRGSTIYVYETELSKALETLRHEVIDYLITSRIVEPLVNMMNALIKSREAEIYREKEKLVNMFSRILRPAD